MRLGLICRIPNCTRTNLYQVKPQTIHRRFGSFTALSKPLRFLEYAKLITFIILGFSCIFSTNRYFGKYLEFLGRVVMGLGPCILIWRSKLLMGFHGWISAKHELGIAHTHPKLVHTQLTRLRVWSRAEMDTCSRAGELKLKVRPSQGELKFMLDFFFFGVKQSIRSSLH